MFEGEDIDLSKLDITTMKGIKRSVRTRGRVLGHRFGAESQELLDYQSARTQIYLPAYRHVLETCLTEEVGRIRKILETQPVVLLDYETNSSITNLSKPLSHASLVAAYVNDEWPS